MTPALAARRRRTSGPGGAPIPRPAYFVSGSEPVSEPGVPVVPDAEDLDFDDFDALPFFAFFDVFALCFAGVEPVALEPVADGSEPEEPVPAIDSDEPLEPIDPDEPLAEDFFDVDFLWRLWCFFVLLFVPVSLPACAAEEDPPCAPVVEPGLPSGVAAGLCASAAPASITAAATAIHFVSNIRSSARLLLDRDAGLRPARNTAGPRNDGFAAGERQGVGPRR